MRYILRNLLCIFVLLLAANAHAQTSSLADPITQYCRSSIGENDVDVTRCVQDMRQLAPATVFALTSPVRSIQRDSAQFVLDATKWMVVVFAIIAAGVIAGGIRAGSGTTVSIVTGLIRQGSIIKLTAILAIVWVVFALGALGTLRGELVASILSGIAGFVLGSASKEKRRSGDEKDQSGKTTLEKPSDG
jgi:hypothetical protein